MHTAHQSDSRHQRPSTLQDHERKKPDYERSRTGQYRTYQIERLVRASVVVEKPVKIRKESREQQCYAG